MAMWRLGFFFFAMTVIPLLRFGGNRILVEFGLGPIHVFFYWAINVKNRPKTFQYSYYYYLLGEVELFTIFQLNS